MYQVVDACGSCISGASGLIPSMDLHDLRSGVVLAQNQRDVVCELCRFVSRNQKVVTNVPLILGHFSSYVARKFST